MSHSMPVVLVTGGYDHKIRFWEATSGVCAKTLTFGESQVNCLQISADKSLLVAGGNPLINIFDINGGAGVDEKPVLTYDGHTSNVTAVGFQRERKWVYSGSEDGTIRIWDSRVNVCTRTFDNGAPVNTVAMTPNETEFISGDQNGHVKVWDLKAGACREEYQPIPEVPIRSISVAFDASLVAVGSQKGKLLIYARNSEERLELINEIQAHDDYLLKCVVSPDLNSIATTSADKTIKLWSTVTWELERTLAHHQRWVWDATFSADSLYLVSASSDQSAKLWDLRLGEPARVYRAHNLAVTCVALNDSSDQ